MQGIQTKLNLPTIQIISFAGLVLHVEDIALLLTNHKEFCQEMKNKEDQVSLREGKIHMVTTSSSSWIEASKHAGFPSFAGFSRLETLIDLCGGLTVVDATFVDEEDQYSLTSKLLNAEKKLVLDTYVVFGKCGSSCTIMLFSLYLISVAIEF